MLLKCRVVLIFDFFIHKKYSRSFVTIHWLFNNVLATFWALNVSVALLSLQGQKHSDRRSYGFGTTWGWVINDISFWMNYLLYTSSCPFIPFLTSLCSLFPQIPYPARALYWRDPAAAGEGGSPSARPGKSGGEGDNSCDGKPSPDSTAEGRPSGSEERKSFLESPSLSHRDEEGEAEFPSASGTSRPRGGIIDSLFGIPESVSTAAATAAAPPAETQRTAVCARRKQPTSTTSSTGWRKRRTATSLTNGSSEAPPCCCRFILTLSLTELTRPSLVHTQHRLTQGFSIRCLEAGYQRQEQEKETSF